MLVLIHFGNENAVWLHSPLFWQYIADQTMVFSEITPSGGRLSMWIIEGQKTIKVQCVGARNILDNCGC